jgi:dTDP-glucose 4,6-dehydratase
VQRLLAILGKSRDLIEFVPDRPGHDRRYDLNSEKIRHELGWKPAVELEEGLGRTVDWYKTHGDWVGQIKSGEYQVYYQTLYENRGATLAGL